MLQLKKKDSKATDSIARGRIQHKLVYFGGLVGSVSPTGLLSYLINIGPCCGSTED